MTISALIVDDEAMARSRIRRLLKAEPGVNVVGECSSGGEAVAFIRENQPDLVFLDVEMPEMDGFAVLAELDGQKMPAIIFVTAYDAYAIQAFGVHALDYLLKPFDAERLSSALQHVRERLGRSSDGYDEKLLALMEDVREGQQQLEQLVGKAGEKFLDRVLIKSGDRVFFVKVDDIDYMEAQGNYVHLHTGSEHHVVRETMANLESRLDPAKFVRIHRSTIVNLDRIRELQPWFSGEYVVILQSGARVKLSRGYRDVLASHFDGKL